MERKRIRCPKCSHEQYGRVECEACGLIFAKYKQAQQRRQEQQQNRQAEKKRLAKRFGLVWKAALLVGITAGTTYYFLRPTPPAPVARVQPLEQVRPASVLPKTVSAIPVVNMPKPQSSEQPSVSIELAREATVSIETPWGSGSGFFISKNYIVTNRHVVRVDPAELAEFRTKVENARKLIELEKEKISKLREQMGQLQDGPSRQQLRIIIGEHQRQLDKVMPRYEQAESELEKMQQPVGPSDLKVILADGDTLTPDDLQVSDTHDLAILSIFVANPHILRRPPKNSLLHQGDKVYTVGSPVGLRNTVTSGVFSGYRKRSSDGELLLQTDAAINPGNSGGPLIDEHGYVRGVNTMILRNTEGIGFAIPIDEVFDDFGSAIY